MFCQICKKASEESSIPQNTPVGIAVKLPDDEIINLIASKRVTELRYFPKAPIKKDYVVLGTEIVENSEKMYYWIHKSLTYVSRIRD